MSEMATTTCAHHPVHRLGHSTIDKCVQVRIMSPPIGTTVNESATGQASKTVRSALSWLVESDSELRVKQTIFDETKDELTPLEDVYLLDDLIFTDKKRTAGAKKRGWMVNTRATMNIFQLMLSDFQNWRRRWKYKKHGLPLFRENIKNVEGGFGSGVVSFFLYCRWLILMNVFLTVVWFGSTVLPTAIYFDYGNMNETFQLTSLFDGQRAMSKSWVFYCSYTPYTGPYHTALAYLIAIFISYVAPIFAIIYSISLAQKLELPTLTNDRYKFGLLVFTSWDHSLVNEAAAENLSNTITNLVTENIHEFKAKANIKQRSKKQRYLIIFRRVAAWIITCILIGGGCSTIIYVVMFVKLEQLVTDWTGDEQHFLSVYCVIIIFQTINIIVPKCVTQLPKMESYASGKEEINVTVARIYLLRLVNLFSLVASLYQKVKENNASQCPGTVIGQEFYKLVILDTVTHTLSTVFINFAVYYWTKKKVEFRISKEVLAVVYKQALIWIGMLFCPILPLIGAVSLVVFFYVNYAVVMVTCRPPLKRWNQSRHSTFFYYLLLIMSVILVLLMAFILDR
ncbi:transmembrane channel-like protein 5 [Tubulanus polymorphus]|uniref:transmembrane channel-like protein 5 n=1 Tax=Tubulanus polymorphus TaxID=672921 RepID=UPI003DA3C67A